MAKKKIPHSSTSKIMLLVLICFFFSGLTGLIYEILWTRMIVKIIGGAPFAVSIVLTVFMGGLGLGSFLAGRTIDRIREPVKLVKIYGILELIIGAYGLAIPVLLAAFRPIYAALYNQLFSHFMLYNLLTFVGCFILLCIPVICMGATLPILCRFYVTKLSHLGTRAGRLYGLNTIGAALGALLCGFWLINLLGVWGTLILAVSINVVIGLSCLSAGHKIKTQKVKTGRADSDSKNPQQKDADQTAKPEQYPSVVNGALIIFAVSGFCAMAYEVIWTKLLGLIVAPTTYSFTIVLVTFILGLALGSMFFGWLVDKTKKPVWLLICTQITAALLVLGVSQIIGNSQLFFAKLIFTFRDHFALLSVLKAVILFALMILPTFCLGATFPLVGKIYTQSLAKVGRSIGLAYTINATGAVLGSFCAGFLLIPLLGKEKSLSVLIAIQIITSLVIAGVILYKREKGILKLAALATPALAGLVLCFHFPVWNRHLLATGKYDYFDQIKAEVKSSGWLEALLHGSKILARSERSELVYYGDGIGGFTTVLKYPDPLGNIQYIMVNSGKPDASSQGDMKTQTLLAHLPMLFHPNAKTVMVLGLASGITAGEVLHYPVEQLDVIDISRQVVTASDFFLQWNNNLLSNPKTNLIIQDGRAHLQLTRKKYDVIISEPSNPWMAGLATLFTSDFFALVENRLNDNGIFVQWLHSYRMDWPTFALVGRSFARVFPNSLLVATEPSTRGTSDYLLVGFKDKNLLIPENANQNLFYARQSKNMTLSDPELLYRLIASEDLQRLFGQGPVNTDNWPRLEFAAPKLVHHSDPMIWKNIQSRRWFSPETKKIIQQVTTNIDAQIDFAAYALSVHAPFGNMVDLSKAIPSQKERFFKLVENYYAHHKLDPIITNEELIQRCHAVQIKTIEDNINSMPDKALSYYYLADLYYEKGMLDEAIANYSKSLQIKPDNAKTHTNLGATLAEYGKLDEAITHFTKALQIKPNFAGAHNNLGCALARQDKLEEAIRHFNEALRIEPDFADARVNLEHSLAAQDKKVSQVLPDDPVAHNARALALTQQGELDKAIMHFREAIRLRPDWVNPMNNLAWIFATHKETKFRNREEAIRLAERACELTKYEKPDLLDTLAAAYAAAGRFADAVATAEKALNLARSSQQKELIRQIQNRLHFYKLSQPYVEPSPKASST